jgi:hypothetical protein
MPDLYRAMGALADGFVAGVGELRHTGESAAEDASKALATGWATVWVEAATWERIEGSIQGHKDQPDA